MKPGDLVRFRRPSFFVRGDHLGVVIDVDSPEFDREAFSTFTYRCRVLLCDEIQDLLVADFEVVE